MPPKRKPPLDQKRADAKRKKRESQTEEMRALEREKARLRMKNKRSQETQEETQRRKEKNAKAHQISRHNESQENKQIRLDKQAVRQSNHR